MFEIKRLVQGDEDKALEVMETFFIEADESIPSSVFLKNTINYLLVAYLTDKPVGMLLGYELQRPETQRHMFFVYEMEVVETQRRSGIGRALIDYFKDICKERHGTEVFLLTNRSNEPAMNLFKSAGGKPEGNDNVLFVFTNED